MIRYLSIRDLAIVDRLEVELEPGFNVLTGETGAGKSIIVGALGLLVGGRASADLVRTGEDRAVVQATFEASDGTETIIRREISARGRGRTFVDDALAAAATLRTLGGELLDLHGQHEHQALLDPRTHIEMLDAYGRFGGRVTEVASRFDAWRRARARLDRARLGERDRAERVDLLTFQLDEIDRVAPTLEEDTSLLVERSRLANAERLRTLSEEAYGTLYERDGSIIETLGGVWRRLDELADLDPALATHRETRDAVEAALDELARALRTYAADIEVSPERLETVETRLADIERLKRKYGGTLDAVLERRQAIADELALHTDSGALRAELEAAAAAARVAYLDGARDLSARRVEAAGALGAALEAELRELAVANGRVEVRLTAGIEESRWGSRGTDEVELFFSANPGETLRPLSKVASGGELSRIMLGLKTLATTDVSGKTLVFDEVDAGVGGAAADRVGRRLRDLGERFQVLCVTHTPQLASHASTHFHVSKHVDAGRTHTRIARLDDTARTAELARLMTGGTGAAALASARELLASKQTAKGERRKRKGESAPAAAGERRNG